MKSIIFIPFFAILSLFGINCTLGERFEIVTDTDINALENDYVVIKDNAMKLYYFYLLPHEKKQNYRDVVDFIIWNIPDDVSETLGNPYDENKYKVKQNEYYSNNRKCWCGSCCKSHCCG